METKHHSHNSTSPNTPYPTTKIIHSKKNTKTKYFDISNHKEPIPVLLSNKDRTKLFKKFNYITNYITKCKFPSTNVHSYLLSQSDYCSCVNSCSPRTCPCILSHTQIYECNNNCSCFVDGCSNRVIQKGLNKKLMLKYINKTKGFGLFADEDIKKGEFVCEYVGCIIRKEEAERKIDLNHKKQKANYVLQVKECYEKININTYIDAEEYGNVGRFINHSCNPNLVYEFIRVEHLIPRVGFFASRNIQKGEELCFLYSDVDNECNNCYNSESKSSSSCKLCECGEKNCKKYIPN